LGRWWWCYSSRYWRYGTQCKQRQLTYTYLYIYLCMRTYAYLYTFAKRSTLTNNFLPPVSGKQSVHYGDRLSSANCACFFVLSIVCFMYIAFFLLVGVKY
jgi:hypothetical protein